tara:strand:- start:78 stop:242 length:165 start_codon:yes stop_codon:yes gene_type:complete
MDLLVGDNWITTSYLGLNKTKIMRDLKDYQTIIDNRRVSGVEPLRHSQVFKQFS